MFYVIDHDTRTVESKCKELEPLKKYIEDNGLSLALTIVDSEDEICLCFSLNEMKDLFLNLSEFEDLPKSGFQTEEDAAEECWAILFESAPAIPTFTPALGKKLLKGATKSTSKPKSKPAKQSTPRVKIDLEMDNTLTVLNSKCKKGSILHTIVTAIEDEFLETVKEVIEYIITNHTIPKTGELADEKFAVHNIKYFIKKEVLSLGEEL